MRKFVGISVLALLAVSPMMASATGAYDANKVSVTNDTKVVASQSYVQGAYNAAIDVVSAEATARQNAIGTLGTQQAGSLLNTSHNVSENLQSLNDAIISLDGNAGNYVAKDSASAVENKGAQQTLHYATGDGAHVGSNLANLDAQVYTNKTALDTLNGDASTNGSVAKTVATAVGTLADGAVADNTAAINTLNGNAQQAGSVDYKIAAAVADLSGANGQVGANTAAIETLNGDADTNGSVANTVATAVNTLANGAVATNTSNIATNAANIATINNKKITMVTSWPNGAPTDMKISQLDDATSGS